MCVSFSPSLSPSLPLPFSLRSSVSLSILSLSLSPSPLYVYVSVCISVSLFCLSLPLSLPLSVSLFVSGCLSLSLVPVYLSLCPLGGCLFLYCFPLMHIAAGGFCSLRSSDNKLVSRVKLSSYRETFELKTVEIFQLCRIYI